jgi:hypothetical protein
VNWVISLIPCSGQTPLNCQQLLVAREVFGLTFPPLPPTIPVFAAGVLCGSVGPSLLASPSPISQEIQALGFPIWADLPPLFLIFFVYPTEIRVVALSAQAEKSTSIPPPLRFFVP